MIYVYYVQVCDWEACWYDSVWDTEEKATEAYDSYKLSSSNFERFKAVGKREMNSSNICDKYLKQEKVYD